MITVKQEEKLISKIKNLSELEFSSLFYEISQHIHGNNWLHIVDENFDSYEDEFEEMQEERDEWRRKAKDLESKIEQIKDLL
jgi:hypothetical protein